MKLKLISKKQETPGVTSFIFESDQPLIWQAGQFMRYHLTNPSADSRGEDRYFTIASAPHEDYVMLTTRFVPDEGSTFKKDLQNLQIGGEIEAEGPSGEFVITDPQKAYVFIAGGIGITPFRAILLDLTHRQQPISVTLLYTNRNRNIVFQQELESLLPNHPNLKIHYFIDPQRIDESAIRSLTSLPADRHGDFRHPTYYVSGPKPMVEAMEKLLVEMGVAEEQIKHDYFPGYQEI